MTLHSGKSAKGFEWLRGATAKKYVPTFHSTAHTIRVLKYKFSKYSVHRDSNNTPLNDFIHFELPYWWN